jgi:hypothetical protein
VYFDLYAAKGSSFSSVTAVVCNLNKGNVVYWWDGTAWLALSDQSFDPTTGCVTLAVNGGTAPSLLRLTGTPFAVSADTTPPTTTATTAPGPGAAGQSLLSVSASATVQSTSGTTLGKIGPIQCWNSQGVVVTLTANDSGAGVKSLAYGASGAQVIPSTTALSRTAVVPTISATGVTTLAYAAVDRVGNQETSHSLKVLAGTVDNGKASFACAAPAPTFALPAHGTLVLTGTATVNGVTAPFSKSLRF